MAGKREISTLCIICGKGFAYVAEGPGRLRRFCSSVCKVERRGAQNMGYRAERRAARAPPREPTLFDFLPPPVNQHRKEQ